MTAGRDSIRDYYDAFSATYERGRDAGYHALVDDLEAGVVQRHVRGQSVLEIGCGTGLVLERIRRFAPRSAGADLSAGMLAAARHRGLPVVQADALALPFRDGVFDTVASFKVLAHVPGVECALAEAYRVARPGGTLVLEFYNRRSLRHLVKRLTGPRRVADSSREDAIPTRWDDLTTIRAALPAAARIVAVSGVRIVTPAAFLHRIPVVRGVLGWIERRLEPTWVGRFGGFLIVVAEKPAATAGDAGSASAPRG